jgi:hypothetical protein
MTLCLNEVYNAVVSPLFNLAPYVNLLCGLFISFVFLLCFQFKLALYLLVYYFRFILCWVVFLIIVVR